MDESAKNLFSLIIKADAFRMPLHTKNEAVRVSAFDCLDDTIHSIGHGLQTFPHVIGIGRLMVV